MLEALRSWKSESRPRSRGGGNTVDTTGLGFTGLIAAWSARHRWLVVAGSIAVLVLAFVAAGAVGMKELDYEGEGDSAIGADILDDRFGANSRPTEQLHFSNPTLDVDDPEYRPAVDTLVQRLRFLP